MDHSHPWTVSSVHSSAAASGWAGWAKAHPEFGSSVNPIITRGADYAQRITASPPGFENIVASLDYLMMHFCKTHYRHILF